MLSKIQKTQVMTVLFLTVISSLQSVEQPKPSQTQMKTQKAQSETLSQELLHYEGDMPDDLANPLDSTNEELDEEIKQIDSLQRPVKSSPEKSK